MPWSVQGKAGARVGLRGVGFGSGESGVRVLAVAASLINRCESQVARR